MKLTKTCAKFLRKHGGTILAIGASIGVGLTMWETGKATVKATTFVTMNKDEPMAKKEIVKDCWKFYIPAAVVGAGTVACILGSNALNKKQLASMTAAYMALGKTYQEYRREVAERIGAEEEKKLRILKLLKSTARSNLFRKKWPVRFRRSTRGTIRLRLSATRKENWPKIPSVTVTECFAMRLGFPMILLLELS